MADLEVWCSTGLVGSRGWLFPNRFGEVTANTYPHWVQSLRRVRVQIISARPDWRAEFEHFSPRMLRHTCASVRLRSGEPFAEVAVDLGHSVRTLIQWYSHEVRASRGAPVEPIEQQIEHARKENGTDQLAQHLAHKVTTRGGASADRRPRPPRGSHLRLVGNRFVWAGDPRSVEHAGDVI
jgi:hypothetical protein